MCSVILCRHHDERAHLRFTLRDVEAFRPKVTPSCFGV